MITAKTTKPVLLAHIADLEAQLQASRHTIKALRDDLHYQMVKPAPIYTEQPVPTHKAYYEYVGKCRDTAKQLGLRVVTYKSFTDWTRSITQ